MKSLKEQLLNESCSCTDKIVQQCLDGTTNDVEQAVEEFLTELINSKGMTTTTGRKIIDAFANVSAKMNK